MNELIRRTWEDSKRLQRGRGWNRSEPKPAPVAYPPRPPLHRAPLAPAHMSLPAAHDVTTQSPPGCQEVTGRTEPDPYSDTGGRGKHTTGALGEVIRHCFGNYAHWRKIQKSPK
jgi:hypothetical protein